MLVPWKTLAPRKELDWDGSDTPPRNRLTTTVEPLTPVEFLPQPLTADQARYSHFPLQAVRQGCDLTRQEEKRLYFWRSAWAVALRASSTSGRVASP
jgi:hypothetical protein